MRRIPTLVALMVASTGAAGQSAKDDLHLSLNLSSDYKRYGLSQTAGDPGLRFAVDYEHDSGFFAGGYAANIDYESDAYLTSPRDSQVDLYTGYAWRGDVWGTSVAASRYFYPGVARNYDYSVLVANASYRNRLFLSVAYTDDLLATELSAQHYQLGFAAPWVKGLSFDANIGRFQATDFFAVDYTHWDVGLSKVIDRFALDLRFHENSADFGYTYSYRSAYKLGDPGGESWVLSVGYAIAPGGR